MLNAISLLFTRVYYMQDFSGMVLKVISQWNTRVLISTCQTVRESLREIPRSAIIRVTRVKAIENNTENVCH